MYGLAVNGQQGFFERKVCANDQRDGHPVAILLGELCLLRVGPEELRDVLARHPHRHNVAGGGVLMASTKLNFIFTIAAIRDDAGQ